MLLDKSLYLKDDSMLWPFQMKETPKFSESRYRLENFSLYMYLIFNFNETDFMLDNLSALQIRFLQNTVYLIRRCRSSM